MHNVPKVLFDLVTGTFPDAMFQHNWWVILMAVATPHKRTPPGRRSKYTWLTCPKTVSVSRIRTIGLSLRPKNSSREAIRHGVFIIRQNRTVEVPWGFFVRAFSLKKTLVSRKLGYVWAVSNPVARAHHTFGRTTTGTNPNQQTY